MRRLKNKLAIVSSLILLLVTFTGPKTKAQDVLVSYQDFYDDLSSYGQWVNDPQYGNVWIPNEDGDFRPYYTNGYWAMTDDGNTWMSDDPWGWICYHYGRWIYDPYYGWVWIPGYDWAPSWVSWRYGDGYCGWAPLDPDASMGDNYNCPNNWWVFVPPQYMYQTDFYKHWKGPHNNLGYIHKTSPMNNAYVVNGTSVHYNFGPKPDVIQRDTHIPIQIYHLTQSDKPGVPSINGNNLNLYRPSVSKATVTIARPAYTIPVPRSIINPHVAATVSVAHQQHISGQQGQRQSKGNSPNINRQRLSQRSSHKNSNQQQNKSQFRNRSTQRQSWSQSQNRSIQQQSRPQTFQQYHPQPMPITPRAAQVTRGARR